MEHSLSFILRMLLILFGIPVAAVTTPFFFAVTLLKSVFSFAMLAGGSVALAVNPFRYHRVWPDVRAILLVFSLVLSAVSLVLAAPVLTVGYLAMFFYSLFHTVLVGCDVVETMYKALNRGVYGAWSAMSNAFMEAVIPWLHTVCHVPLRAVPHNHPDVAPSALNAYRPPPFTRFVRWLVGGYYEFHADLTEYSEHFLLSAEGTVSGPSGAEYLVHQAYDCDHKSVGIVLFNPANGQLGFFPASDATEDNVAEKYQASRFPKEPVIVSPSLPKCLTPSPHAAHSGVDARSPVVMQQDMLNVDQFKHQIGEKIQEQVKDLMTEDVETDRCAPTESLWSHFVHQQLLWDFDTVFNTTRAHVNLFTIIMRQLDLIGSIIEGVIVGGLTHPLYWLWVLYWTFIGYPCSAVHKLWHSSSYLRLVLFLMMYPTIGWAWSFIYYSVLSLVGSVYLWCHYFFVGKSEMSEFSKYMILGWPLSW